VEESINNKKEGLFSERPQDEHETNSRKVSTRAPYYWQRVTIFSFLGQECSNPKYKNAFFLKKSAKKFGYIEKK